MLRSIIRGGGVVALGTAAGQGIVLMATPWLARQYTPAEFGALALLLTVSNIATAVACARYDLALPAASDAEAVRLLRVAAVAATIVATCVLVVLSVSTLAGANWPAPFNATWLVTLCVLFVGLQQANIGAATRERRYSDIGAIRFGQGGLFALLASIPGIGLIAAHAISFAISLPITLRRLVGAGCDWRGVARAAHERRDFPMLSLPGAILDVVGYSACVWILVHFFGPREAGQYSQIQRIIGAPLMLVGMSAGQVLLRVGVEGASNRAAMSALLLKLGLVAALLGLVLVVAVALVGEPVLHWLLGPQWRVNTAFVVPITIAVTVRACVSPLSTLLITLRRFDLALRWQAVYFVSSIVILALAATHFDLGSFVLIYAAHELLLYSLYFLLIAKAIWSLPCAASSV